MLSPYKYLLTVTEAYVVLYLVVFTVRSHCILPMEPTVPNALWSLKISLLGIERGTWQADHSRHWPLGRDGLRGFSLRGVACSSSSVSSELVLLTSNTISFPGSTRRKLRHSNVRCPAGKDTRKQSNTTHNKHSSQHSLLLVIANIAKIVYH